MSDLNWQLRDYLHELRDDDQLAVLICIYLHRNARNRAWPSNQKISRLTGVGRTTTSNAIQKLLTKRAFVLVPYDKRVGEETKLPKRKNIYQLTGVLLLGGKLIEYMHLTPEGWHGIAYELSRLGESSASELLTADCSLAKHSAGEYSAGEPKGITESLEDNSSDSARSRKRERNPLFDAVAQYIFEIDAAEMPAEVDEQSGRIGAIAAWLGGKTDSIPRGSKKLIVGRISAPAEAKHVEQFAREYRQANPNINLPHDGEKFVEAWRKWASSRRRKQARAQQPAPVVSPATPERRAELAAAMAEIRPPWKQNGMNHE